MSSSTRVPLASSVPVPKASVRTTRSASKYIQKQQETLGLGTASARVDGGKIPLGKGKLGVAKDDLKVVGIADVAEDSKNDESMKKGYSMRVASSPATSTTKTSRLPKINPSFRLPPMAAAGSVRPIEERQEGASKRNVLPAAPRMRDTPGRPNQIWATARDIAEEMEEEEEEQKINMNTAPGKELHISKASRRPRADLSFRVPAPPVGPNPRTPIPETALPMYELGTSRLRQPSGISTRMGHQRSVSANPASSSLKAELSGRPPTGLATLAKARLPTPAKHVVADTPESHPISAQRPRRAAGKKPQEISGPEDINSPAVTTEKMNARQMEPPSRRIVAPRRGILTALEISLSQSSQRLQRQAFFGKAPESSITGAGGPRPDKSKARKPAEVPGAPINDGDRSKGRAAQRLADAQSQPDGTVSQPPTPRSPLGRQAVHLSPQETHYPTIIHLQTDTNMVEQSPLPQRLPIASSNRMGLLLQSSTAITTPSKIPRLNPMHTGRQPTTPKSGPSPVISPTGNSHSAHSPPERILFPRVEELAIASANTHSPLSIGAATPSSNQRARMRKDSNVSDIDDRLKQSMQRLPRTSGLSPGWSPRELPDLDSGRKAKHIGGRVIKQSPLASSTQRARIGERPVLGSSVNGSNIDTPLYPIGNARTLDMEPISTPETETSLQAQLREVNASLEQENLSLAFELVAMEAQAAQNEAARREAAMASVWKDVASGIRLEMVQLQREKAMRKREVENFDKMVELAILAV